MFSLAISENHVECVKQMLHNKYNANIANSSFEEHLCKNKIFML